MRNQVRLVFFFLFFSFFFLFFLFFFPPALTSFVFAGRARRVATPRATTDTKKAKVGLAVPVTKTEATVELRSSGAVICAPPDQVVLKDAADRYHYVMKVLTEDLALPVEREDIIHVKESAPHLPVPMSARKALLEYILHEAG
jgi:hypothetical protein